MSKCGSAGLFARFLAVLVGLLFTAGLAAGQTTAHPLARSTGQRLCLVHYLSRTVQCRPHADMAQAHPSA